MINELTSYDINRKLEALSALNRIYDLNQDEFLLFVKNLEMKV